MYKQGAEFTSMGGCTENTQKNQTDSGCCCIKAGTRSRTGGLSLIHLHLESTRTWWMNLPVR